MSDNGATPQRRDDQDSAVLSLRIEHTQDEVSDHGHRLTDVEKGVASIRELLAEMRGDQRGTRRLIGVGLTVVGILVPVSTFVINLLMRKP